MRVVPYSFAALIICSHVVFFSASAQGQTEAEEQNSPREDGERPRQITKPPRLIRFVKAEYPTAKKAAGITATVELSIEIGADGLVGNVTVIKSAGEDFDKAAIAATKQFVFDPAEVDNQPAPVKITYRYQFRIKTEIVKLGPQINFEGVVLERFTKRTMANVKVTITDIPVSTVTDDQGHFQFIDLPLGPHRVELSSPILVTVSTEEKLLKDTRKTVKYLVEKKEEGIDEELVVRAPRIKKESVETTIRTEEARRVPGTQGDTLKVVQNLPGVARSSFGSGQIIVWGSAPKDTRVVINGVEVPALYHMGGLRSTINSDLVKSIDLLPGGYGPDYGRGLGGLVKVETRPLPTQGIHGYLGVDFMDVSGMISAVPHKRLRLGVAGRYSYLDRLLSNVVSEDYGDFFPIPQYQDYQAMASVSLRQDEELSLLFLGADDHLQRSIPSEDPAQARIENSDRTFYRLIVRYSYLLANGASVNITPSWGWDTSQTATRFGEVPTQLNLDSWRYGLRSAYRRKMAKPITLSLGLDLAGTLSDTARRGSINLPSREGDIVVFGQPPGDDVNADQWSSHLLNAAPFVFTEIQTGPLTITPGLRFDAFLIEGSQITPHVLGMTPIGFSHFEWSFDPRLNLVYHPFKRLSWIGSVGIYHQPPESEELSVVFGNPTLSLSRAIHYSLGSSLKLTGTLSAEVVGFYKQMDDLIVRNQLPTPPLARALTQDGIGRSYGGQIMLRQELVKGFMGWITYSLSRSERRDHPEEAYRLFDYDQTHVLGLVSSYEYKGWIVGARFRYTTGMPRTPVIGTIYDARGDQYQPLFGDHNSLRIPDFIQLDLRLERTLVLRQLALNIFIDAQNVTNRKNPEEIVFDHWYTKKDYITGLPTLVIMGARIQL